ncbi:MAG: cytochrome c oxidase assembly protein [Chloroflexota bacterium]|nr:cytochrome c oxidase assembly protein [Chloroflexota bacterium]
MLRTRLLVGGLGGASFVTLAFVQAALARGGPAPQPTLATVFSAWSGDLLPWLGITAAAVAYLGAVGIVNRAHPATPVPRWRITAWLAGVAVITAALVSAVDVYADSLFSVHMVQHLLLAMVAPPLLAMGAPVTLALRVAPASLRRSLLLPILHSRLLNAISWPPVSWTFFAGVMWITHFSPLFNAALENDELHHLEHLLYLAAGLLFWWPAIGADPMRWRLRPIARMVYLGAQMPFNTAVGLAIYFAPAVLYPHYLTLGRTWGPDPFTDQQVAGIVMWGIGDVILLGALVLAIAAWLRADERQSRRIEERATRNAEARESARGG